VESRNEVQLDLRPVAPIYVHDRHQPIEAGVTLERNSKRAAGALLQPREIALGGLEIFHHSSCELDEALACGGQYHRLPLPLDDGCAVVDLERTDLVRYRRLTEANAIRSRGHGSDVGQRHEGAKMADFQHFSDFLALTVERVEQESSYESHSCNLHKVSLDSYH
jgi:hypothetical protein